MHENPESIADMVLYPAQNKFLRTGLMRVSIKLWNALSDARQATGALDSLLET